MNNKLLVEVRQRMEAGQNLQEIALALGIPYHKLYYFLHGRGLRVTRRSELTKLHEDP